MEVEKPENAEIIIKAKLKQLEFQAMKYELEINKIASHIFELEKENRKYQSENNAEKCEEITKTISRLRQKIKQLNKQKEEELGCELNLTFRDDFRIKTKVNI